MPTGILHPMLTFRRFIGSLDRNGARRGIIIYSEKMSSVAKKVRDAPMSLRST
jgi:hypothetical protein